MFKGNIFITTDMNIIINQANMRDPNTRIVFLDEVDPHLIESTGGLAGYLLLPDYNGTCARLDNDMEGYRSLYIQHLMSESVTLYIGVIFRVLLEGANIIFYMSKDSYEMYFPLLNEFFMNSFGLCIGTAQSQPVFNINFTPQILTMMYLISSGNLKLLSFEEFMLLYPQGIQLNDDVIRKMADEINPFSSQCDGTFEWYRDYFYRYKEDTQKSGKFLKVVARRVE